MLQDEVTRLIERGHPLPFVKGLDLLTFQDLADSSERVWRQNMRFQTRQHMIAAQGTAKSLKDFMKELMPKEEQVESDAEAFSKRFGGG